MEWNMKLSFLLVIAVIMSTGCGEQADPEPPSLTPEEQAELDAILADAEGKADGFGLFFFDSTYVNLTMAGRSDLGDFALVAG